MSSNTQVMREIRALTVPRDRDILVSFYLHGTEMAEICARFYLEPAQFDRILHRARARVRKLLMMEIGE